MQSLVTLNLNNLTAFEAGRRDTFYEALATERWTKVKGTTLDTVWIITWVAGVQEGGADQTIRQDIVKASAAARVPTDKVEAKQDRVVSPPSLT